MTQTYWTQLPIILGIDTSCDDTSAAVVQGTKVLSNIISSQVALHQEWGGVVPVVAKRAHQERISEVVHTALRRARVSLSKVDALAVTYGPGLAIALEVGIKHAQELRLAAKKPLLAINHMEGHALACIANFSDEQLQLLQFPALCLLVSGGHTELVYIRGIGQYELIGYTVDDAAGEAFDKVARLLGLGYPGGATLSRFAKLGDPKIFHLPVPMLRQAQTLNFSFSGLKAAAMRLVDAQTNHGERSLYKNEIYNLAATFEHVTVEHLIRRTTQALSRYPVKSMWLGGGVAANLPLRSALRKLCRAQSLQFLYPHDKKLCMDNAAMIALAGAFQFARGEVLAAGATLDRDPVLSFPIASERKGVI